MFSGKAVPSSSRVQMPKKTARLLKMRALHSFQTMATGYLATQRNIPEEKFPRTEDLNISALVFSYIVFYKTAV
jgi:hypothetical protein